jgi:hypothetical protein
MPTRNIILGTIAAMLAGCSGQVNGHGVASDNDPSLLAAISGCSYPQYNCGRSNGTGVYYQEGGFAGMSSIQVMITNFINTGSQVQWQGRFSRVGSGTWQMLPLNGSVTGAYYNGVYYRVRAVSETGTLPTWTLVDTTTNANILVSGASVYGMYLNINFYDQPRDHVYYFQLWFGPMQTEAGGSNSPYFQTTINKYSLWYRDVSAGGSWTEYCTDINHAVDPVVFQQGMFVAPTSGQVFTNSNDVTLSCRLGAIATVYWWGYDYHNDLWHYEAGIHMKRASYCGDDNYYTVGGTIFQPQDDGPANWYWVQDAAVEASWSPTGALCYTQPRRPDLAQHGVTPFNGYCNGNLLPTCASIGQVPSALDAGGWDNLPTFLIDGVVAGQ